MKTISITLLLLVCFIYNPLKSQITWKAIDFPTADEITLIKIGPDNTIYLGSITPGEFYLTVAENLFASHDDGLNWEPITVNDRLACNDLYIASNNSIYMGAGHYGFGGGEPPGGIFFSRNGIDWEHIHKGGYEGGPGCGHVYKVRLNTEGDLLAITDVGGLYQYDNDGEEWRQLMDINYRVNDIITNENNEYFACAKIGLLISSNEGEFWEIMNTEHSATFAKLTNDGILFVATVNEGIYTFDRYNLEWEFIGLAELSIQSFLLKDEETIIASTEENGIFYTNDKGQKWVACNDGLDSLTIKAMTIAPTGHIYVSTGYKVFKSNETFDGIYQAPNSTGINTVSNNKNHLYHNYPNPFSGQTAISFSLEKEQNVCLSVYNSRGQLVDVILREYKAAGSHKVIWQVGNNPPGIYYYRLETANGTALSKPMLLVSN